MTAFSSKTNKKWIVLVPLYLGAIVGPLGGMGIIPLIPTFVVLWGVSFGSASLALSLYMVSLIVVQLFSGSLAKLLNVKYVLLFGFSVYAFGSCLCGFADSLPEFLWGRVIQGVGSGFLAPVTMAHIGELVSERHIGKAMGLLGMAYTFGVTAGPFISGQMEVRYGWFGFFFFLAVLAAVAGLTYGLMSPSIRRNKEDAPLLPRVVFFLFKAVKEPGVLWLSFAAFSLLFGYTGIMTFTADYLRSFVGLSSDWVGGLLSLTGVSGIIASPLAGILGDRMGRKKVFLAGTFVAMVSIGLMMTIEFSTTGYIFLFFTMGAGIATGWTSLNTLAVQASTSLRQPVMSVYSSLKFSGYAFAPIMLSFLYGTSNLKIVQGACLVAILLSFCIAFQGVPRSRGGRSMKVKKTS